MMKMNRIFVPVGQGAFYIEDFTEGVVIYDCGSSTKTDKEIANIIDSYFKKKGCICNIYFPFSSRSY